MGSLWRQAADMAPLWGELYWMDNVMDRCLERGRKGIRGTVWAEGVKRRWRYEEMRGCRRVGLQVAITKKCRVWSITAIYIEYILYFHTNSHSLTCQITQCLSW